MESTETKPEADSLAGKTFDLTRIERAFAQERLIRITEAEQRIKGLTAQTRQSRQDLLVTLRAEAVERLALPPRALVEFTPDETGVPVAIKIVDPDPPEHQQAEAKPVEVEQATTTEDATTSDEESPALKMHKGKGKSKR